MHLFLKISCRYAITIACLCFTVASYGQCRNFVFTQCLPQLSPYTSDGQYHGTMLMEGDSISLIQTFYSAQNYRLKVCTSEHMGDCYFRVKSNYGYDVYSNENNRQSTWDFNLMSTQKLTITLYNPITGSEPDSLQQSGGCISILIGHQ